MTWTQERRNAQRDRLARVRTPASQRKRRLDQIASEEAMAEKMRSEGWEIFSPTVVCDRVGIKDNKVFFVEFKRIGQQLRDGQKSVQSLVPENYLVRYEQ